MAEDADSSQGSTGPGKAGTGQNGSSDDVEVYLPGDARLTAPPALVVDIGAEMVRNTTVITGAGQELVMLSRDRIENTLSKSLARYSDLGTLVSKAGIFLALLLAVVTTETKATMGLSKDTWQAIIVLLTVASFVWMLVGIRQYFRKKSVEDIVNDLLNAAKR